MAGKVLTVERAERLAPKVESLLSRGEAARVLGVSKPMIILYEKTGRIRPVKTDDNGWSWYRAQDLLALKAHKKIERAKVVERLKERDEKRERVHAEHSPTFEIYATDEALRVFEALDEGLDLVECVKACKVHPLRVRAIAQERAALRGEMLLSTSHMHELSKLPLEGSFPFEKAEDLILAICKLAGEHTCEVCEKRKAAVCGNCIEKAASALKKDSATVAAPADDA